MSRRNVFLVIVLVLLVGAMASAVAADMEITVDSGSFMEENASSTLEVVAVGTSTQVGTFAYNRSAYATVIGGSVFEFYVGTIVNSDSGLQYLAVDEYVPGVIIDRHAGDSDYSYRCVASRYGVSNPSYANSSTLAEQLAIDVSQIDE